MRRIKGFGSVDFLLEKGRLQEDGEQSLGSVRLLFKPENPLPPFGPASLSQDEAICRVGKFPEPLLKFRNLLSLVGEHIFFTEVPEGVVVKLFLKEPVRHSGQLLASIARKLRRQD